MKLSTEGLVIWQTKTGEAHRVITLLTPDGTLACYARNSLRPNNRLASATALFCYSDFELFSGGSGMYTVDEAAVKTSFRRLSADVEGLALATYFAELMKLLAPVDDDAKEYLKLMLNTLYLLDEGKKDRLLIKSVFELRLMTLAGYMPNLVACSECAAAHDEELYFDLLSGEWLCASCAKKDGKTLNCSGAALKAMQHIVFSDAQSIFSFNITGGALDNLSSLCEHYVVEQTGQNFSTLEFLKTLMS